MLADTKSCVCTVDLFCSGVTWVEWGSDRKVFSKEGDLTHIFPQFSQKFPISQTSLKFSLLHTEHEVVKR